MFALLNLFEELKYCSMLLIQEYIGGTGLDWMDGGGNAVTYAERTIYKNSNTVSGLRKTEEWGGKSWFLPLCIICC